MNLEGDITMKVFYYRKLAKKRQKDIAEMLGITVQNYSLKENGKRSFKANEMRKVRDYLNDELNENLTIDELFF